MIHGGPVPYAVHGILDYLAGLLLIAAPFVLGYSQLGAPTAVSIVAGVFVLVLAASTIGPTNPAHTGCASSVATTPVLPAAVAPAVAPVGVLALSAMRITRTLPGPEVLGVIGTRYPRGESSRSSVR